MKAESRTWRALEAVARAVNERKPQRAVEVVRRAAGEQAVRVLDRVVSRLAGTRVRTLPEPEHEVPRETTRPIVTAEPRREPVAAEPAATQLAEPSPEPAVVEAPEPPRQQERRFGIDRVVLLIRQHDRAFAYWEIDGDRLAAARGSPAVAARGELRLIDAESGEITHRAAVDPVMGKLYIDLPAPGTTNTYTAELVLLGDDAQEKLLSRSTPAQVPPARSSGEASLG